MPSSLPRVQVTVDPELAEAMAAVDPSPASRSRLIRDLAIRGAAATRDERERGRPRLSICCGSLAARPTTTSSARGRSTPSAKPTLAEPFSAVPLVVDTSAWVRQRDPAVLARWEATLRAGLIVSCPVVALELLAAAPDEDEYTALAQALEALPQAPVTTSACRLPWVRRATCVAAAACRPPTT